jgi:hypothetical protein
MKRWRENMSDKKIEINEEFIQQKMREVQEHLEWLQKHNQTLIQGDSMKITLGTTNTQILEKGTSTYTPERKALFRERNKKAKEQAEIERQIEECKRRNEMLRGQHFIQCYLKHLEMTKLSLTLSGNLLDILQLMKLNDNGYIELGGKKMSFNQLKKELKKSNDGLISILNHLKEINVILTDDDKPVNGASHSYRINPEYFKMQEMNKHESFIKLFKKTYQEKTKGLKPAQKGLLLHLMPYFHYKSYYLCRNPFCEDPKDMLIITLQELATKLGVSEKTIKRYLEVYEKHGIITILNGFGTKGYVLHPDLVFRQDAQEDFTYTEFIRDQFIKLNNIKKQEDVIDEKEKELLSKPFNTKDYEFLLED